MKSAGWFKFRNWTTLLARFPFSAPRRCARFPRRFRSLKVEPLETRNLLSGMGDDFGDTFVDAELLTLDPEEPTVQTGILGVMGDLDVFRFLAPVTGTLTAQQHALSSGLTGSLRVFDEDLTVVVTNDIASGSDSRVSFAVSQGRTYFIEASAFGSATGEYQLTFTPSSDDSGNALAEVEQVLLSTEAPLTLQGNIEVPRDRNMFRFEAPISGPVLLRAEVIPGSNLNGFFEIFLEDGFFPLNGELSGVSESILEVEQGRTYFLRVGGFGLSTGRYTLTLTTNIPDDFGDTFDEAEPVSLAADRPETLEAVIETSSDVDVFRFEAPASGVVTVSQATFPGSNPLVLSAFDEPRNFLQANDSLAGERDLTIPVEQEQVYFLEVRASDFPVEAIGDYLLTVAFNGGASDDFGDTFAEAEPVDLSADVPVILEGAIERDGDVDVFRFEAPTSGMLTVSQNLVSGSNQVILSAFNENRIVLAGNDFLVEQSKVTFPVEQGQTYFLQVENLTPGEYSLSFTVSGRPVLPPSSVIGNLETGDQDSYEFRLTQSGRLLVRARAESFPLRVSLIDGEGNLLIQSQQPFPGEHQALIVQHLDGTLEGKEYSVRIEGVDEGAGAYELFTDFTPGPLPFRSLPLSPGFLPFAQTITAADFNSDGHLDLAGTSSLGVSVLLGLGEGSFQEGILSSLPDSADVLAVGDFNQDQRPDLAVGSDDTVSLLLGLGDGTFRDGQTFSVDDQVNSIGVKDLNGDGIPDLAVGSFDQVSILLGLGDGTFREDLHPTGDHPHNAFALADFNRDGRADLVTANTGSSDVSVLLGRGDDTFQDERRFRTGIAPVALTSGDFNGDGVVDLGSANGLSNDVSVLLGLGDGTFQDERRFRTGTAPVALVSGDFNGDGVVDLVTANAFSNNVSVLLGRGDGTFQDELRFPTEGSPSSLAVGDFNRDGALDLVLDALGDVFVLLGLGDGTFQAEPRFATGRSPQSVALGDFNGDGRADLVTANAFSNDVSVLLGLGDGTFQDERRFRTGIAPVALASGDLNDDGRTDLVTANAFSNDVSVLLGLGDGTFQDDIRFGTGTRPHSLQLGDFNGDGVIDLVAANVRTNDVSVLLGRGDGTFQDDIRFKTGARPYSLQLGDFNGDGVIDLVTANVRTNDVSVLLGRGDGTFQDELRFRTGNLPGSVAVGDFNGDSVADLVTANGFSDDVSVLLGRGDGTFRDERRSRTGDVPSSVTVGDFNGDSVVDLVTANAFSNDVSVLPGLGDGTFQDELRFPTGSFHLSTTLGDFNRDGFPDLAVVEDRGVIDIGALLEVSVFFGQGDGTFQDQVHFELRGSPGSLAVGDFNGDNSPDLAQPGTTGVSVLLREGTSQREIFFPTGVLSTFLSSVAVGDINGDGRPDLVTANPSSNDVSALLGFGEGLGFVAPDAFFTAIRSRPVLADLDGDGNDEVAVLDRKGDIHIRSAPPEQPGAFNAPTILSAKARDMALLRTTNGLVLASLDVTGSRVSLHAAAAGQGFLSVDAIGLPSGQGVRLTAADLNQDGTDDLVVAAVPGTVLVSFQEAGGRFAPFQSFAVGPGPADLLVVNVDGQPGPEILTANFTSGDVSILFPEASTPLDSQRRFRTGLGLHGITSLLDEEVVQSGNRPVRFVAGHFDPDNFQDLIVLNSGSRSLFLLRGAAEGGFLNPEEVAFLPEAERATEVVTADFNKDGDLDLAVLEASSGTIALYLGDGQGSFNPVLDSGEHPLQISAGNVPTGLTATDLNEDGNPDLLVGNEFGDVLAILGNGDGTFRPFIRPGQSVPFATADFNQDGLTDVLVTNQSTDEAAVLLRAEDGSAFQTGEFSVGREEGLEGPVAPTLVDLNQDGRDDMVFANSGSNTIVAFLAQADGSFAKRSFFVGTNPTGITVDDLDGNGIPDLAIANEGSNDVSILLGQGQGEDWTFTPGPRLNAGGVGPVSVEVRHDTGNNVPDLLVTNRQDGTITVLPGRGQGLFNDTNPQTIQIPTANPQLPVTNVTPEVIVTGPGAVVDRRTLTPLFLPGPQQPRVQAADRLDNVLVTASNNGAISVLTQGPTGGFTATPVLTPGPAGGVLSTLTLNNPGLTNPSNVQVVRGATGFEVFVTQSGSSTPFLFSFAFSEPLTGVPPVAEVFPLPSVIEESRIAFDDPFLVSSQDEIPGDSLQTIPEPIDRILSLRGEDNPPAIDIEGGLAIPGVPEGEMSPPRLEPLAEGSLGVTAVPGDGETAEVANAHLPEISEELLESGQIIGLANPDAIANEGRDEGSLLVPREGGADDPDNVEGTWLTPLLRDLSAAWIQVNNLLKTAGDHFLTLLEGSEEITDDLQDLVSRVLDPILSDLSVTSQEANSLLVRMGAEFLSLLDIPVAIPASLWRQVSGTLEGVQEILPGLQVIDLAQQTGEMVVLVGLSLEQALSESLMLAKGGEGPAPASDALTARGEPECVEEKAPIEEGEESGATAQNPSSNEEAVDLVFSLDWSHLSWVLWAPLVAFPWLDPQARRKRFPSRAFLQFPS